MAFLEHFKNQVAENVFVKKPKWRSSYLNSMIRSVLEDSNQFPIINPDESKVLIEYCMNHDIKSLDRKGYLNVIQFIHLNFMNISLDNKLKKISKKINEDLSIVNSLQEEVTVGINPNINKEQLLSEIQVIKDGVLKNKNEFEELSKQQANILAKSLELKKYFDSLHMDHKKFEVSANEMLEKERKKILSTLRKLYARDEHNQLTGFVYTIKEAYKESLKGRDLKSMLEDISTAIVAQTISVPGVKPGEDKAKIVKASFLKEFIDGLSESDELFANLELDMSDHEQSSKQLNCFLNMMVAIHNFIAKVPSEQKIKSDFIRKMSKIEMEEVK